MTFRTENRYNFGPMLYNSYLGPLYDNWSIITQLDLGLDLTDKNE